MPDNETFLDRLKAEQSQLDERMKKLGDFLNSANFNSIASMQRVLLTEQFYAMQTYNRILMKRLELLTGEVTVSAVS